MRILGVTIDCKLVMSSAVDEVVNESRWRMKMLLSSQRFFNGKHVLLLYKQQILSFIEYRTAAIYHCCDTKLAALNAIQDTATAAAGMSTTEALLESNLAPLQTRRDMAMLGLIHRTVLGLGPSQFAQYFKVAPRCKHPDELRREPGYPVNHRPMTRATVAEVSLVVTHCRTAA